MAELTGKTISELPSATALADTDLFAISSGGTSKKIQGSAIKSDLKLRAYTGTIATGSNTTLMTISDSWITSNTIVVSCQFGNPMNVGTSVTWTSSSGSVVFTGTAAASTSAFVVLAQKGN